MKRAKCWMKIDCRDGLLAVLLGAVIAWLPATGTLAAKAPPFTVAENGKALAVIQVPEKAPPAIVFAAQELKGYLEKITGAAFSIQNKIGPAEGLRRIVLGDCEESRKAGLDVATLPPDGFFLRQVGDALYVCGQDDPTLRKDELIACQLSGGER